MASQSLTSKPSNVKTFQGASKHTEKKEYDFKHLIKMRLTWLKTDINKYAHIKKVLVGDLFCGTGYNIVKTDEGSSTVFGSPFGIMDALEESLMCNEVADPKGLVNRKLHIRFNDIRADAAEKAVGELTRRYSIKNGIWTPCENLSVRVTTSSTPAADFVESVHEQMSRTPEAHAILLVDPNGPSDFPQKQLVSLVRKFPTRVDLVMYISATAVNRSIKSMRATKKDFKWLNEIEGLDSGFILSTSVFNRNVWIREPLAGDPQHWIVIPSFTPNPYYERSWTNNGFHDVRSVAGRKLINFYSGTKEAAWAA